MQMFGRRVVRDATDILAIDPESSEDISHHGIKGQKWGVRRYQNPDGSLTQEGYIHYAKQNMKKAKARNLDKWGKDPNHNVLYIIGTSGSGKSTTAKGLASNDDSIIHLDTLLEKEAHKSPSFNKDFEHFLRNKGVDIDKARDATIDKKERWKAIDDIGNHVESYGRDCYNRGKRVIIEGAQMGDDTMFPDKNYFKDKPTITMKNNYIRNSIRASRRDGDKLIDTAKTVLDPKRKNWYNYINKNIDKINNLSHSTLFGNRTYLAHHGIKGQQWGVQNGPPYPLKPTATNISDKTYSKINELYKSMPLSDRRLIDPDISDEPQDYFSSPEYYKNNTAFNSVSDHGFVIAEKIPKEQNIDGTNGVEIGIGVTKKGRGIGTGLTKNLVDWFDNQNIYDVMWWPVDKQNIGSIRIAEKNGFIKDPLGSNYIYAKEHAKTKLGIV